MKTTETWEVYTEYYSKWRNEWVAFKKPPTRGEILEMKKYHYKLR